VNTYWPDFMASTTYHGVMTVKMAIHEIKDHLSSVIAALAETGEEVEITKHGRVVARLMPPRQRGVVLGVGAIAGRAAAIDDLRWSDEEIAEMVDGPVFPA
jgi:prevent-host-death family protein